MAKKPLTNQRTLSKSGLTGKEVRRVKKDRIEKALEILELILKLILFFVAN